MRGPGPGRQYPAGGPPRCLCGINLWARPEWDPAGWRRHLAHMRRFERAAHTPAYWASQRASLATVRGGLIP